MTLFVTYPLTLNLRELASVPSVRAPMMTLKVSVSACRHTLGRARAGTSHGTLPVYMSRWSGGQVDFRAPCHGILQELRRKHCRLSDSAHCCHRHRKISGYTFTRSSRPPIRKHASAPASYHAPRAVVHPDMSHCWRMYALTIIQEQRCPSQEPVSQGDSAAAPGTTLLEAVPY